MSLSLFDLYKEHGITHGKELYILSSYALKFVEDCTLQKVAVLGIEGFKHENQKIIPLMDEIADLSSISSADWEDFMSQCNSAAKKILEVFGEDSEKVFNFVLMTQKEWIDENV
ncbi:hypothetical protein IQ254_12390 [Nodosilinea sp. LEGE 07088]|uniref:hypothetical protein n=1 Tax=Nodosilinea sp. LEGE 07088 TaxID=2777968 RepID=UPI00187E628B|nr:hypothetical protein [Nodosilinea sp. LEGE 07088]MBE9137980.1 hypothetical protein [Nodosilinea sp. LEGE 07088]